MPCKECKDQKYIINEESNTARSCEFLIQENMQRKFRSVMIPEEFIEEQFQQILFDVAKEYVEQFDDIVDKEK